MILDKPIATLYWLAIALPARQVRKAQDLFALVTWDRPKTKLRWLSLLLPAYSFAAVLILALILDAYEVETSFIPEMALGIPLLVALIRSIYLAKPNPNIATKAIGFSLAFILLVPINFVAAVVFFILILGPSART